MRITPLLSALGAIGLGVISANTAAAQVFWAGVDYTGFTGSPFQLSTPSTYFSLEDFEDSSFVSGFSTSAGWYRVTGSQFIDSVDEDDGSINGNGNGGGSFYSGGLNTSLVITFDEATLGSLPTQAGFVWTDIGGVSSGPFGTGPLEVDFYDDSNTLIASTSYLSVGDGLITGQTAEDLFFGYSSNSLISRIEVRMPTSGDWEIDHIQFGYSAGAVGAVPEPSTIGLIGAAGLLGLGAWRRVRKTAK